MSNKKIGVFDSGVGGLTVLKGLHEQLPNETFIYIGDNKHSPYGEKTYEQLLEYTTKIVEYFIKEDVKMIVLACNTTSCTVLDELRKRYPQVPILGVTEATCQWINQDQPKQVLVMATNATIQSQAYQKRIGLDKTIGVACPQLVPLIENAACKEEIDEELKRLLTKPIQNCDSVVLGCTHYPIVASNISELFPHVKLYSSSDAIVEEVNRYLDNNHLYNTTNVKSMVYTTGNLQKFIESASAFFDFKNYDVQWLDVEVE